VRGTWLAIQDLELAGEGRAIRGAAEAPLTGAFRRVVGPA
jgi:hypothetical protein